MSCLIAPTLSGRKIPQRYWRGNRRPSHLGCTSIAGPLLKTNLEAGWLEPIAPSARHTTSKKIGRNFRVDKNRTRQYLPRPRKGSFWTRFKTTTIWAAMWSAWLDSCNWSITKRGAIMWVTTLGSSSTWGSKLIDFIITITMIHYSKIICPSSISSSRRWASSSHSRPEASNYYFCSSSPRWWCFGSLLIRFPVIFWELWVRAIYVKWSIPKWS